MTYKKTFVSSSFFFLLMMLMMLFMSAMSLSLFSSEYVGLYEITLSKVSPMMAISMFRKVICVINVESIKIR